MAKNNTPDKKTQVGKNDNSHPAGIDDIYKMTPAEFKAWVNFKNPVDLPDTHKKKTSRRTVQAREPFEINPEALTKFTRQGSRYGELVAMAKGLPKPTIKPLGDNKYMVLKSGEIREFEHHDRKQKDTLKKTFAELKGIIRANFDAEGHNQLFVTLTYAENMRDPEWLYMCFKNFWQRLKYEYPAHRLEYVAVAEPQARGAWHMHLMVKSDQPVLYIDNKDMERIWGWGYTSTERLKGDDVGSYYVSYFTSLELEADTLVKAKNGSKRFKKGARLPMYPVNFKMYRCSKGIIRPKSETAKYKEVVKEYGQPYRKSTYDIMEDESIINSFQQESFKKPENDIQPGT